MTEAWARKRLAYLVRFKNAQTQQLWIDIKLIRHIGYSAYQALIDQEYRQLAKRWEYENIMKHYQGGLVP